jgi:hypothetical protein
LQAAAGVDVMAPRAAISEAGISVAATAITPGTIIPGPAAIAEEVTAAIAEEVTAAGAAAMGEAAAIKPARVCGCAPGFFRLVPECFPHQFGIT